MSKDNAHMDPVIDSSKSLAKLVGRGSVQAKNRMETASATAKVVSILAGAVTGNVLGRLYPTELMGGDNSHISGTIAGGIAGWAGAELAEALGAFKADMGDSKAKDLRDAYIDTPISAYIVPGYAKYYQQQLGNRAIEDTITKRAAALKVSDVQKIREFADKYNLDGRDILNNYDDKQITMLANGIGPNSWSDTVVRSLNKLAPYAVPAAVIHDLEWSRGIDSRRRFKASNKRFRSNIDKGISSMAWYNPMKYVAYMNSGIMKSLVDTNFKHYREGLSTSKSNYNNERKSYLINHIDDIAKMSNKGVTNKARYAALSKLIEDADKNASYVSGYTR